MFITDSVYYVPSIGPVRDNGRQSISVFDKNVERIIDSTPEKINGFLQYRNDNRVAAYKRMGIWAGTTTILGGLIG